MQISWTGVLICLGGLGSVVALNIWGGEGSNAIQMAILAGVLGLLAPHPIKLKEPAAIAPAADEPADEDDAQ